MVKTPFDAEHYPLEPVGKYILLEITQEEAEKEKKVGSIICPGQNKANMPTFGLVKKIGNGVAIDIHEGDFIEVNGQWYPNIVDADGFGRFQLVHEDQVAGVYKKK